MGDCASRDRREAQRRSDDIDRQLKIDLMVYENTVKILLLGAGESGKSTIVKQMKIIHGDGFSQQELESFTPVVYANLAESILRVVNGMDRLGITLQSPINQDHAQTIKILHAGKTKYYTLPQEVISAIQSLWEDEGFQECFRRAYEYQLNDSASYYFENLSRLLAPGYVPTEQDVLRSRVATTGVVETSFFYGKLTYRLVDVGGQRTERRKWIQRFDDVRAVLFVSALNEYDMTLFEEEMVNRLEESLNLFQAICNSKYFVNTTMILFLNKRDLFQVKILNSDRHLRLFYPWYTGPDRNLGAATCFIQDLFLERILNKRRVIYQHITTATDTSNIKVVFRAVLESIIHENLDSANLL